MATAVEVRKAGGGMHPVVMQVNSINLDTFLARFTKLLSPTDTFRLRRITRAPLQWYHLVSNLFFSPLLHPPQATIFPPAHHRLLLQEPATSYCWAPEALWATPSCSSLHPRGWWGRAPWRGSRNSPAHLVVSQLKISFYHFPLFSFVVFHFHFFLLLFGFSFEKNGKLCVMDWVPPCPDLSCLKRRIVIRICPQMAEDATGRCGGPRGDDYLSALPADKSNISICPTSAHNLYIPLYIVKHQTFLYPWDLCGTSLTHSPSLLITSTFFFFKNPRLRCCI